MLSDAGSCWCLDSKPSNLLGSFFSKRHVARKAWCACIGTPDDHLQVVGPFSFFWQSIPTQTAWKNIKQIAKSQRSWSNIISRDSVDPKPKHIQIIVIIHEHNPEHINMIWLQTGIISHFFRWYDDYVVIDVGIITTNNHHNYIIIYTHPVIITYSNIAI